MLHVLLFLGSYVGGFVGSFLYSPILIFVLYQAVYFFNPANRWWSYSVPSLSWSFFVSVGMIGIFIINRGKLLPSSLLKIPQFKWAYVFCAIFFVTYFYAAFQDYHMESAINLIKLMVIISIAYKLCDTDKKFDLILFGYMFGAWYLGLVAYQTGRNGFGRIEGIGMVDSPDSNGTAAAIAPVLIICLYFFWIHKSKLVKAFAVICGAFAANAIVLINSRGSFLAVGASAVYFMYHMYFSSFQRKYQKLTAIMITVVGLGGFLAIADDSFFNRFATIFEQKVDTEAESAATRTMFWLASVDMAKDFPLGKGANGFVYFSPIYLPQDLHTGTSRNRAVHSTWFEALSEVGWFGLFCFLMMLFYTYRTTMVARRVLREEGKVDEYFKVIAIQSAFLAFAIAMTFMNRMRAEILYWCILYSAVAYNLYVLQPKALKEAKESKSKVRDSMGRVSP